MMLRWLYEYDWAIVSIWPLMSTIRGGIAICACRGLFAERMAEYDRVAQRAAKVYPLASLGIGVVLLLLAPSPLVDRVLDQVCSAQAILVARVAIIAAANMTILLGVLFVCEAVILTLVFHFSAVRPVLREFRWK